MQKKTWMETYNLLVEYKNQYGDVNVPFDYVVDGYRLGLWLRNQLLSYHGVSKTKLTDEQIKLLEDLGVVWRQRKSWKEIYLILNEYYNEHGNINAKSDEVYLDFPIGSYIKDQRASYFKGKLSEERIKIYEGFNIAWSVHDLQWRENYDILKKYYDEHGNIDIKYEEEIDGKKIGAWLFNEKREIKNYSESERKKYRVKLLEDLGVVSATDKWNIQYEILKKYYKKHGNCRIPRDYVVDGYDIYFWCVTQRRRLLDNDNLTEDDKQRIIKLNEIEFIWYLSDRKLLNSEIDDTNNDKFNLALLRKMKTVLTGLELENKNKISTAEDQEKIEKLIIKRLFK